MPGATTTGYLVTAANVEKMIPGLNTLGVSFSRVDFAPEIVFVLDVGFLTTANKLVAKTITEGDIFVFPRGASPTSRRTAVRFVPPAPLPSTASSPAPSPSPPLSLRPVRRCPTMSSPRPSRSEPRRWKRSRARLAPKKGAEDEVNCL
ncbi:hypothetical protein B296_00005086 [Ensete ventricosum]|uniref:Uncharacterized protein n=1 Tax=Ensete ventricosum TaxID=4639 RepID=A0A426Z9G9_ENSVE|nr:hypothetical protein B296_00005086 [Ensete ventricosum]